VTGVTAAPTSSRTAPDVRWLTAALEWQSRAVVLRHLRVYLHNWHTAFLPPVFEPVTMLLAFGLGLGGYVANLDWQGRPVDYLTYVAPGLLAYAAFMTAVFQALFAAFIRMRYQRTWEGQLTTQVELRHVVWGEVLWAALLATIYVLIIALVLAVFALVGLVELNLAWLPLALPIAFVGGCGFAAFGLCFTALVPTIDHMNLPVFLVVIPMGLLSGTYFPITHPLLAAVSAANPLYHLAQSYRGLLLGGPVGVHVLSLAVLSLLMVLLLVPLDLRLLRRRVLGD
jgi:lipooligosaccharide transport system permease protein